MRKTLLIILTALILILTAQVGFPASYESQISSLSSTIVEKMTASGKKSVVVIDFTDLQGNVSELGRFIAEELSADLINKATGFNVIDRNIFKGILKEHKFSISGLVDPAAIQRVGKIAGVDILITGSITPFGDNVRISCKVIVTDTVKVIGSARGDLTKTKAIEELLAKKIEPGATIAEGSTLPSATEVSTKTAPVPVKPQAILKTEVDNFTFEAKECRHSGKQVVCTVSITNNSQKKRRLARCSSNLSDDKGQRHKAPDYGFFGGDSSALWADIRPNLPLNIEFTYPDVDPEAKYADVVINCSYCDGKAEFEKINLIK